MIWRTLHSFVVRQALKMAMRRRLPNRVTIMGGDAETIVGFHVRLFSGQVERAILVDEIVDEGIAGRCFSDDLEPEPYPIVVPNKALHNYRATFYRRSGLIEVQYRGAWSCLILEWLFYPGILRVIEWFTQKSFNLTTNVRRDRMQWLEVLLEHRRSHRSRMAERGIVEPYAGVTASGLLQHVHSWRIFNRPSWMQDSEDIQLILNSLVQSGDAALERNLYKATDQALATLSDYSLEERRHRTQSWQNWAIVGLTGALLMTTIMQLYWTMKKDSLDLIERERQKAYGTVQPKGFGIDGNGP